MTSPSTASPASGEEKARSPSSLAWARTALLKVIAVALGLLVAAIAVVAAGANPVDAYTALFQGAFTNTNAVAETLLTTIPYIFLGLSVSVGFRAGLFNIGGAGQLLLGAIFGAFVGYKVSGLPAVLHVTLALMAGMLGGFLWGAIPGLLKARFGAHEVITTIMLNYVAALLTDFLVNKGPMSDPRSALPETPPVLDSARLPIIVPGSRLHLGLFLTVIAVAVVWMIMERTTLGFRIRAVGLNARAARSAGMSVEWTMVTVMGIAGALAGLAGIVQVLGVTGTYSAGLSAGTAFDSIAVALLAGSNPVAIVPAALLFGALKSGASYMQLQTQVSADLISVVQATVIVFVAAPLLVRWLIRLRAEEAAPVHISEGGI